MNIKHHIRKLLPYVVAVSGGCEPAEITREELSDILHEKAVVSDVVYVPSRHGSGSGMGPTIGFDGKIGIALTNVNIDIPAKYAVVFECEHGKFISEGTDERHKALWKNLKRDQTVEVTYREMFESTYRDIDGDGKRDLVKRTLIGYDFLDAKVGK